METPMNVAIVGCGLVGQKRARALGDNKLVTVADTDRKKAELTSRINNQNAQVAKDWQEAIAHPEVELVIVATTNDYLVPVSQYAIEQGKNVLVEKPAARSVDEFKPFLDKALLMKSKVKVGFNLRFHPAITKAKEIVDSGEIGKLMFVRARYGHGGRLGYDKEWRANPRISGGGELIDQGVHLIDLARWFLGDFKKVEGFVHTYFWQMPVDDNAFLALETEKGQMAWLHVSCTEWKNMFSYEVYGKYGKLQIDGLGGSYGPERLTYYKMPCQMGPPEAKVWEYPGEDKSWEHELADFIRCIKNDKPLNGDLIDAYKALEVVNKIYRGKNI